MKSSENHHKTFHNRGEELPNVAYSELKSGLKGAAIGEEDLFVAVNYEKKRWRFRLYDVFADCKALTGWVSLRNVEELRVNRNAKPIRDKLKEKLGDNAPDIIEKIIGVVQDNREKWMESETLEKSGETPQELEEPKFDEETRRRAIELLRDPAFFYKLGWVFHHGFVVPKINQPRFVIGEERNKRLLGLLLIGAAKHGMTSIIKLLGEPGTAKDTMMRMWLRLLPLKSIERSYLTAASMRYSKHLKSSDVLYIPDSPEIRGEMGRHLRFMRADDGGLISEYAAKDPITGEMTTQVVQLPVKAIATTSNALTFDPALESGMWTLRTDDSIELTRQVKEEKLRFRAGERPLFPEEELKVWRCAFHILLTEENPEQLPMVPYARELIKILESERSESRRDPDKLCDLISLVGWARRFQKPSEKRAETDIVDLYIALQLGLDAIKQTIGDLNEKERRVYNAVKNKGADVTVRMVVEETGLSDATALRYLDKLVQKGFLTKDKERGRNIYNVVKGKEPKNLLISDGSSFNDPKSLMELILNSFGSSSSPHQDKNIVFCDPISGERVKVSMENPSKPRVEVEKIIYVYPYEVMRSSERSQERVSDSEKKPLNLLPPENSRFSASDSKSVWLWRRVPPGEKCELCGQWAVEYEVKPPMSRNVVRRCEKCFNDMRAMFKKALWKNVEEESGLGEA